MDELKGLGFTLTYSGVSPKPSWGAYWVHVAAQDGRKIAGYGDDEAGAIADALQTVKAQR